jgi:hypothetical protein
MSQSYYKTGFLATTIVQHFVNMAEPLLNLSASISRTAEPKKA